MSRLSAGLSKAHSKTKAVDFCLMSTEFWDEVRACIISQRWKS